MHKDSRGNSSWSPFLVQTSPAWRLIEKGALAAILDLIPFQFSGHKHDAFSSQEGWTGAYNSLLNAFPSGPSVFGVQDLVLV
jgi:hypothetical protein